jgi:hypothetical protein
MMKKQLLLFVSALLLFAGCNSNQKTETEAQNSEQMQREQMNPPGQNPNRTQEGIEEVTNAELEQFLVVAMHGQELNEQAQGEMVKAIEDEGLKVKRYSELQQMEQNPEIESDATQQEIQQYQKAIKVIEKKQMELQEEMVKKLGEEGLSQQRYQEINMLLQADPELQKRLQELQQNNAKQ